MTDGSIAPSITAAEAMEAQLGEFLHLLTGRVTCRSDDGDTFDLRAGGLSCRGRWPRRARG